MMEISTGGGMDIIEAYLLRLTDVLSDFLSQTRKVIHICLRILFLLRLSCRCTLLMDVVELLKEDISSIVRRHGF